MIQTVKMRMKEKEITARQRNLTQRIRLNGINLNVNPGEDNNNQDLPDAGHTFVYPIYYWGNRPNETINRYLPTNVEPDDNPSNIGWTTVNHPRYTTNPNLYPHFSVIEDPYDLREDEEGKSLYQILVGRTQIPTSQVKDEDWFWL